MTYTFFSKVRGRAQPYRFGFSAVRVPDVASYRYKSSSTVGRFHHFAHAKRMGFLTAHWNSSKRISSSSRRSFRARLPRTSPVVGSDRAISLLRLTAGPGLLELEAAVDLAVWSAYRLGDKTARIAQCYTRINGSTFTGSLLPRITCLKRTP